MRRGGGGIAHVVQAVEAGDQIEVAPAEVLRPCDLEGEDRQPVRSGVRGRGGDRAGEEVVAREPGRGERLRHQDGQHTVHAADVGQEWKSTRLKSSKYCDTSK